MCLIKQKKKKREAVGIGKIERSRNREMWDNSEKYGQRKKRSNADINNLLLFTTLTRWSGLTHLAQGNKVVEQESKRDVKNSGKFRNEKSNELKRIAKRQWWKGSN